MQNNTPYLARTDEFRLIRKLNIMAGIMTETAEMQDYVQVGLMNGEIIQIRQRADKLKISDLQRELEDILEIVFPNRVCLYVDGADSTSDTVISELHTVTVILTVTPVRIYMSLPGMGQIRRATFRAKQQETLVVIEYMSRKEMWEINGASDSDKICFLTIRSLKQKVDLARLTDLRTPELIILDNLLHSCQSHLKTLIEAWPEVSVHVLYLYSMQEYYEFLHLPDVEYIDERIEDFFGS